MTYNMEFLFFILFFSLVYRTKAQIVILVTERDICEYNYRIA